MSVLVKGMEMPKNCNECPLHFYEGQAICCCRALPAIDDDEILKPWKNKRKDCPLTHVPPHGRLIDAAEITEHKYTTIPSHRKEYADGKPKSDEEIIAFKFGWNYAIDAIVENAPTIIQASDKDTNVLSKEERE